MTTAYLFPGQGSQQAEDLAAVERDAPDLLSLCAELIGHEPFTRCDESTRFAQPAILLASLAAWRRTAADEPRVYAGHSLGEISALTAAGALTEADAVRLAVVRGEAMARAGETSGDGSMLAVLKGTVEQAQALADEHGLSIANDNAPGQVVVSGPSGAIDAAQRAAGEHGLRALELNVSAAFHSPAMADARAAVAREARQIAWGVPDAPVYSGLTAKPFCDPVAELPQAIVSPVRWREIMAELGANGCDTFVEVGGGDVLAKLVIRNLGEDARVAA